MAIVFRFSGDDMDQLCRSYSSMIREEYFDGQFEIGAAARVDLTVEKALTCPISLIRTIGNTAMSYRRTWQHIRSDKVGLRVLWFIRRGTLKLTRSSGDCVVLAGECAVLDSSQPFLAQAIPDHDSVFDAVQAIIPSHLFFSHLPGVAEYQRPFQLSPSGGRTITRLLEWMFDEGDQIRGNAAEALSAAFLEVFADKFGQLDVREDSRRQSLLNKRVTDIKSYVSKHLTDPDLTYEGVAEKCGISPRYLCYVLKASNTSFSSLLWGQRLPRARDWLTTADLADYPVQEIAFMAGFKSAAHFSRVFKDAYGCTPKEYRVRAKMQNDAALDKSVKSVTVAASVQRSDEAMMAAA